MLRIKELRESKRMNQQGMSFVCNVSQAMISKYELGQAEPDIQTLITIAQYFSVSVDYLIGVSDDKMPINTATMSGEEKELLYDYKQLNEINKAKANAFIKGLLATRELCTS
jgi:transcriptional regulator with XRE-family HTH domain